MSTEAVALVLMQVALVFYVAVGVFGCAILAFLGLKFLLWDAPRAVVVWYRERRWRRQHPPEPSSGWQWYAGAGQWYDVHSEKYADYLRSLGLDVEERGAEEKEEGRG